MFVCAAICVACAADHSKHAIRASASSCSFAWCRRLRCRFKRALDIQWPFLASKSTAVAPYCRLPRRECMACFQLLRRHPGYEMRTRIGILMQACRKTVMMTSPVPDTNPSHLMDSRWEPYGYCFAVNSTSCYRKYFWRSECVHATK